MKEPYITDALLGDINAIKKLDDLAFKGHKGITTEEIENIINAGAILLLWTGNDKLIGQSQVLLKPFDGCPEFPENLAYCYGTGIHPEFQGKGFGGKLAEQQERYAKEAKCDGLFLTARPENYASVAMRLRQNFLVTGYHPNYYGPNPETAARISMTKMFDNSYHVLAPLDQMFVGVKFGDDFDQDAHNVIQQLISDGYVGVEVFENGIQFMRRYDTSELEHDVSTLAKTVD